MSPREPLSPDLPYKVRCIGCTRYRFWFSRSPTPYDKKGIQPFYASVQRSTALSDPAINTVFEQLLMSLHRRTALRTMRGQELNLARAAIMTWYYGIYCAASAMIAAKDGTQQQDHVGTANVWDRQIVANGHAMAPFSYRLTTLENPAAEQEIATLRGSISFNTSSRPSNASEAFGACISYLSGTREYRVWQVCEDLKQKELPKLGLTDFRKNHKAIARCPTPRQVAGVFTSGL